MERFVPVLLGADIGVYALARAFHEKYGIKSVVICAQQVGAIADSSILTLIETGSTNPEGYLAAAKKFAAEYEGDETLLLIANSDSSVRAIVENRADLAELFKFRFLDLEVLDRVSDKIEFARLCEEVAVPTPKTYAATVDSAAGTIEVDADFDLEFPIIAKASRSSDYEYLRFAGKKKVYLIESQEELDSLLDTLVKAGFTGRFALQEVIDGDDTLMWSITAYVDGAGEITMLGSAHVLLEDHAPTALGNPVAMITTLPQEMLESAVRMLRHCGYRGFANFDIKINRHTNEAMFLEVNPRIGRNNYYMTAAGVNPTVILVNDVILDQRAPLRKATNTVLYSVIPVRLLKRYISGKDLAQVKALVAARQVYHPLRYPGDLNFKRRWYLALAGINHFRKFRRYYPKPTSTGF